MRLRLVCGITIICSVMSIAVAALDAADRYWPHALPYLSIAGSCRFTIEHEGEFLILPDMTGGSRVYWWSSRSDGSCHAEDNKQLWNDANWLYKLWGNGI